MSPLSSTRVVSWSGVSLKGRQGDPRLGLAQRLHLDHVGRQVEDRLLHARLALLPGRSAIDRQFGI
jgi:hypothetical protein